MKEFSSQTGGRYTYVDDIINLQDLALAFGSIFDPDDNFVVSGCELSGGKITEGYVWLNGKLRHFDATDWTSGAKYICEVNTEETVPYANGDSKVGRSSYGCTLTDTFPSGAKYISVDANGVARRFREAFFGKYALLLDSVKSNQEVNTAVKFNRTVSVANTLTTNDRVRIVKGNATGTFYYEGDTLRVESSIKGGKTYRFGLSENDGLLFQVDGLTVFMISDSICSIAKPIEAPSVEAGNITVTGDKIYNSGSSVDSGAININVVGYEGKTKFARTTNIGNGKGGVMINADGKSNTVSITASTTFFSSAAAGIILRSELAKTNTSMSKLVYWRDSNNDNCASLGFPVSSKKVFRLENLLGDIEINAVNAVNCSPVIKENGVLLTEKYVTKEYFNQENAKKANVSDVYSKASANETFAAKNSGLVQFVSASKTKDILCGEIGAATTADFGKCALKEKYLADMAATDEDKKKIRTNIGAVSADEVQKPLTDTGWVTIVDKAGRSGLHARQIGNIVSIQGTVNTIHEGTVFVLPASINPPRYAVGYHAPMQKGWNWCCKITANSKECQVVYCDAHGYEVPFSMTYMV